MRSFDVFFVVAVNKLSNKQSSCWCCETAWRAYDATVMLSTSRHVKYQLINFVYTALCICQTVDLQLTVGTILSLTYFRTHVTPVSFGFTQSIFLFITSHGAVSCRMITSLLDRAVSVVETGSIAEYTPCYHTGAPRAYIQYEERFSRYGDSHYEDKTVARPSYLYYGNSYIGKIVSLYWDDSVSSQPMCWDYLGT